MSNVYQGSPTESQRVASESDVFRKVMRAITYDLRVAMPGIIRSFDPTTQLCTVDITIADKQRLNNAWVDVTIPTLQDVLLMLPGDANYCITFPNVVGSECLVIVADMCINAWWATGPGAAGAPYTPRTQEVDRRHDFSDTFAVLAPRSKPNAIQNYSTTEMQLRSMDGTVAVSLSPNNVEVSATNITLDGALELTGTVNPTTGSPTFELPIKINGVAYQLQLKAG